MTRSRLRTVICSLALAASLASPARAEEEPSVAYNALVGFGSALGTLIYSPLKVAYAGSGLVISSLAFLWTFGDTDLSGGLFRTTVGGDYVVTPSHLEGNRNLRFRGQAY